MLYSSGTTGRPKGVERPLSGVQIDDPAGTGMAGVLRSMLGMTAESIYLCPAPLYHAAGLQWSSGTHELGGTVVVMEKFDAEQFLMLVEREAVTHSQVVPTMLVRLMKLPSGVRERYDHSSLECVVHAAAPCPVEVKHQVIDWLGPIVHEYFAATEGNGMTFISAADWLAHPGSVGRPMMGIPHICDDEGRELPVGEPGLIYFEQEQTSFEYHGDPEKTRASRHPEHDNWSALGDIGYVDHEGYIYLTDRKAFTIIAGGVNIYPAEIEACLIMHPKVTDVAVFGLPDPEMGEYVHAVVQPADGVEGCPELADALLQYAREHLARYKVPRVIDFRAELPRLPTGKLYKQGLRDDYRKAMA
jgi:long-chain acyl-CoA synthetase